MITKRIIPCLDVRDGRVVKGVNFENLGDVASPVDMAKKYTASGADELVFYDITASAEERGIFLDVVERVASQIFIPFSVGGGISSVADMRAVLNAGAEKVSINSAAVRNPDLVADGAAAFGSQAIVVGMDVLRVPVSESIPSGYEIVIQGGRRRMGIDAIEWARQCQELGAGELCVNSIDADGTRDGYELTLTRAIVDEKSREQLSRGREALVGFDRKVPVSPAFLGELKANDVREFDFLDWAEDILILHGTADEIVPFGGAAAFSEEKLIDLIPVEGADHRFRHPGTMETAMKETVNFFGF